MVPTREHWRIQDWAQKHGAKPAQLRRLKYDGQPAVLTFVFDSPETIGPEITLISWEMFFAEFDLLELSMAWDEHGPSFDIVRVEKNWDYKDEN